MGQEKNTELNYPQKNVGLAHGLNQINGYLRRGLHLEKFDPSRHLIEPRIWIYAGNYRHLLLKFSVHDIVEVTYVI